jgi:hypothetical protein
LPVQGQRITWQRACQRLLVRSVDQNRAIQRVEFRNPWLVHYNDVLLLLMAWFHMITVLENLNDVGSQQIRHPQVLSRIRAHLEPGNDGVRYLSNESRIQELPPFGLDPYRPFLPQISITYSVTQHSKLACCPMDKPQSTRESSASKRRSSSEQGTMEPHLSKIWIKS